MMNINETATKDTILERVMPLVQEKCRFVTMTAVDCDDHFDLYYHFDRKFELYTIRVQLEKPGEIVSISTVCFPAIIIENEIQDLFGIKFNDLALDFQNRFILADGAPEKPFCHVPGVKVTTVEVSKTTVSAPAAEKKEEASK